MKKLQIFFLSILITLIATNLFAADNVDYFNLVMNRIQEDQKKVNISTTESNTAHYLSVLNTNGSFPDINYDDRSQTSWNPIGHLDRLKTMVLAYTISNSKYYNDSNLYNMIVKMFNFWYDKHPTSTNWYNQQIACPQQVGILLILMRSGTQQLPTELEDKLLARMASEGGRPDQSGSQGTGANKLDIATHWIYRGCLKRDASILSFGVNQVYYPIYLTTAEGLQYDYSYQQHGNQLYVGGYGHVFVNGISSIAKYMVDTPYALSGEKLEILSLFMRKIYLPIIRGRYFLFNTLGRGVARQGGLNQTGFATVVDRMILLDPTNKTEYENATKRLREKESPNYGINPTNTHFWRSDYTLHQRPGYTFDVRTVSKYVCRNENGNGENLKGYFLADGGTDIAINGDEYVDIFPVWDWTRIPGVTAPVMASIPKPAQWGQKGTSSFAGGVSDGKYGVSTYWLNDNNYSINTTAKKSWFFFDNEVVCLGAGITSTATQAINTTINQSLLKGDVIAKTSDSNISVLNRGNHSYVNPTWVLHNGIGYVFPKGGNISISNDTQKGSWKAINSSVSSSEILEKDVFKMWFDHGLKPTSKEYAYIVVPNKSTKEEMSAYSSKDIEILANTDSIQAVRHKGLNLLSIVFYKAATFKSNDISIVADKGCAIILKNIGTNEIKVSIADPSKTQKNVTLLTTLPSIEGTKELKCTFSQYPDPYAGSSLEYSINKDTPSYVPVTYQYVYASEDAWVRDGSFANTNYGTTNTLTIKKDGDGYNREAYIKFNLQNIDLNKYGNIYLALYVSNANSSIQDTKWSIGYVSNDNWTQNTLTWNNAPTTDNVITEVSTVPEGSNIMVDITQTVLNEIKNGNKELSLHISSINRGADGKTDAQFYSTNNSNRLKIPQLMLAEKQHNDESQSLELVASDDAWVRDGSFANTNYGKTNTLTIKKDGDGYNREVYFKFNLENTNLEEIDDVVLKLAVSYANASIYATNWQIIPVANTWTESNLTWANRPKALSGVIASAKGLPSGSDVNFDITDYVRNEYVKGNKVISLHISSTSKGTDGKTDAQFYSKEFSDVNKYPKLLIKGTLGVITTSRSIIFESASDELSSIKIYPNPLVRGNTLYIELPISTNTAEIKIIDMSGRIVMATKDHTIDGHELPSGLYVLSIRDSKNPEFNRSLKLLIK